MPPARNRSKTTPSRGPWSEAQAWEPLAMKLQGHRTGAKNLCPLAQQWPGVFLCPSWQKASSKRQDLGSWSTPQRRHQPI